MFELILIANAIWFGLAFHLFTLRSQVFAKILVPKAHRDTPVFNVLVATGPFLGGFNLAFCALNLLVFIYSSSFPADIQRATLCSAFALAHGSQFVSNIPIVLENRKGGGVWQVKGLMLFIFVTDFSLMAANTILTAIYAW